MITITIYNTETGLISRVVSAPESFVYLNVGDDEGYLQGSIDRQVYYVEEGQAVAFPPKPSAAYKWDHISKTWVICENEMNAAWVALRAERDVRLLESDKYTLPDYPISAEQRNAWLAYRIALRELPELTTDPLNPSWPEPPTN